MYLNHNATLQCTHGGQVIMTPPPLRSLNIMQSPVITDVDLMQAFIVGCAQISPATTPCTTIVAILMGDAQQIFVDGEIPILDSLQALTDGVPPGFVTALTNGGSNASPALTSVQLATMVQATRAGTPFCPFCQELAAEHAAAALAVSPSAAGAPLSSSAPASAVSSRASATTPAAGASTHTPKDRLVAAQDAARSNPDFAPGPDGTTHCNQATASLAQSVGAPTGPLLDVNGQPLLANQQAANLATSTEYTEVTPEAAQQAANDGRFVIAAYDNPDGHGHVATVRPDDVAGDDPVGSSGPALNDIGASDRVDRQSMAFRRSAVVRYYTPSQE